MGCNFFLFTTILVFFLTFPFNVLNSRTRLNSPTKCQLCSANWETSVCSTSNSIVWLGNHRLWYGSYLLADLFEITLFIFRNTRSIKVVNSYGHIPKHWFQPMVNLKQKKNTVSAALKHIFFTEIFLSTITCLITLLSIMSSVFHWMH